MKRKLKTEINCDNCHKLIKRKSNQTWIQVLTEAEWNWQYDTSNYIKTKLLCNTCITSLIKER